MLKFVFFRVVDYTVLCAILMLIAIGYSFVRKAGRMRDIISVPVVIYLLLATFLLLGITYTSAPIYGLQKSSRFATLGLIAFLAPIIFAHSMKEIKLMIWIIIVGAFVIAIGTIMQPYSAVLRVSGETRGGFLEASPLTTAVEIGAAAIICSIFVAMAHTSKRLKIFSVLAIPLFLAAMIITGSRGPFLGIILTWLVAGFICHREISKAWLSMIAVIVTIALMVSFIRLPQIATERISRMWKSGYDMKAASLARTELFTWATSRIPERPIFGHGTGAFAVDRGGLDETSYPHNIILEVLYEQGLVGAIILFAFLWLIFRRWRHSANLVQSYLLAPEIYSTVHISGLLFLFTLTQAMKSGDIDGNRFMFFFAGMVIAVFNLVRHMAEEITLETTLTMEGEQPLEGFGLQDTQISY
jgi:O-antigen ligase